MTPTVITVGADTKTTIRKNYINQTGKHLEVTSITTCKFGYTNGIYYVLAGTPDSECRVYATEACQLEKGIDAVAAKYSWRMNYALNTLWNNIRLKDSQYYRNRITESAITFFAFENGKPRAIGITFLPISNNPLEKAHFKIATIDLTPPSSWPMGQYTDIQDKVLNSATWRNKAAKNVIVDLIEEQRRHDPDIIGKPYDVLEVTAKGVRWLTPDRPGRISLK